MVKLNGETLISTSVITV